MDNIDALRANVTEFAKSLDMPPFIHKLNDLLNQRAWEQAAAEEKLAMQKIADMWAIVQDVATEPATYYDEADGERVCVFCNGLADRQENDRVKHEADCIVMKARQMVAEAKQGV